MSRDTDRAVLHITRHDGDALRRDTVELREGDSVDVKTTFKVDGVDLRDAYGDGGVRQIGQLLSKKLFAHIDVEVPLG